MEKIIVVKNNILKEKVELISKQFNIFVLDEWNIKNQVKLIKEHKAFAAVLVDENSEISFLYKNYGAWKIENTLNHDLNYFKNNKFMCGNSSKLFSNFLLDKDSAKTFSIENTKFILNDDENDKMFISRFSYFTSNDWAGQEGRFDIGVDKFRLSTKEVKTKTKFNNLIDYIKGNDSFKDFKIKKTENEILLVSKDSNIVISENGAFANVDFFSKGTNEVQLHYDHNDLINKIVEAIEFREQKSFGIKNTLLTIFGFTFLIFMMYITFSRIFNPENISSAIKIFGDANTYKEPWVYLIFTNFIINLLFSWFTITILHRIVAGKWPSLHETTTYILSIEVRGAVRFLTGSWAVSAFAWGYFIKKRNNMNTSSIVTMFSVSSLLALSTNLLVGLPMMITGTIYLSHIFDFFISSGALESQDYGIYYSLVSFAWISNFWNYCHHGFFALVAFIYPVHFVYNQIMTTYIFRFKSSNAANEMEKREYSILKLKQNYKMLFSKERIKSLYLLLFIIVVQFANELIIMPSILNLVEGSMYSNGMMGDIEKVKYTEWYSIASVRLMINWAAVLPLIDLIPFGIPEFFQTNFYQWLFIYKHGMVAMDSESVAIAKSFSDQATFINRFFHIYLRRLMSVFVLVFMVVNILIKDLFLRKEKQI